MKSNYNRSKSWEERTLEPIGNIPPKEFEMMYYERQEVPAMVVGFK
jgi:hypothetical protein